MHEGPSGGAQARRAAKSTARRPEVMQVIPRTYDLVLWLIPRLKEFPREQRFLLGDRIQTGAMDLLSLLIEANYTARKEDLLRQANLELEKTRYLLRMASDLHYLNGRRYEFAAATVTEIGRMIGGWIQATRSRAGAHR